MANTSNNIRFKRVLLKLSGEALAADGGASLDSDLVRKLGEEIKKNINLGVQFVLVVGGGNILRGASQKDMNREDADYCGMLATLINSITLCDKFNKMDIKTRVMSSIPIEKICDSYYIRNAKKHLEAGETLILGGGMGDPYFTTDTNASLKACELFCDCILKATKVDGVYDSDPVTNPNAKRYSQVSFNEVLDKNLRVMDLTAISMCKDNNIPLVVFNIEDVQNISKVLQGNDVGTFVYNKLEK